MSVTGYCSSTHFGWSFTEVVGKCRRLWLVAGEDPANHVTLATVLSPHLRLLVAHSQWRARWLGFQLCVKRKAIQMTLDWTGTHIYMASMAGMYVYYSDLVQCIQCVVYPTLATLLQGQCSTN